MHIWSDAPEFSLLPVARHARKDPQEITKTLSNRLPIAETEEEAQKMFRKSSFKASMTEACNIGIREIVKNGFEIFMDIGVEYFILRFLDFSRSESTKLFAKKVTPRREHS